MVRWLLAALLLAGSLLGVACGDDDDDGGDGGSPTPTLQAGDGSEEAQFLAQWVAIHDEIVDKIEANSAEYPGAFEGDLEETKVSFPIYLDLFDEFDERAAELDVPESLSEIVDEGFAIDADLSSIQHQRADLLEDATTYEAVDEIFGDDPEFTAISEAFVTWCEDFHAVGEEHDIVFDRECD